ncbi:type 3 dihydrofolate reductase [Priestia koreensis]|uniref:Dihydrofolate reductase n=1 Tax=Priestia koreensis TaxID=284581 RepID=A0A0M0LII2_9BACI|nr:type 3 dihydrofolate reductase [Priestia koreensis]KOO50791.1 dihydrofolate reductase [Priestia koreensis]
MISLIAAMDQKRLIGADNDMPWRLPADLAYFKKVTMGHPVVMGRKTFESIGRPLPGRENIVITRNADLHLDGVTIVTSLDELQNASASKELFVIGGGEVYQQTMAIADRLYITHIEETFEGDTHFPEIDVSIWEEVSRTPGIRDEKNPYSYSFVVYERR